MSPPPSAIRTPDATKPAAAGFAWPSLVWFGLLILVSYGPALYGVAGSWFDDRLDMGHGMLVPLCVAYMIWSQRRVLLALPAEQSLYGLLLVVFALVQFSIGSAADWRFATRSAFVLTVAGSVLYLRGYRTLRALLYPFVLLVLMVPPPTFLYTDVVLRLQLFASRLAEMILELLGYSVLRDGNILELVGQRLSVEEACSGIRSLITLVFFCLVYNYFLVQQRSIRWVLLLSVTAIATLSNALRIVLSGVLGRSHPELAQGMFHAASGYVLVIIAGVLILALHRVALVLHEHARSK